MQRLMLLLSLPGSNGFGFEQTAEAIMGLLDGLHVENTVLVGYSLGARLALYLAEKHGHRLQTVVSISGSTGLSGEHCWPFRCHCAAGMCILACAFASAF